MKLATSLFRHVIEFRENSVTSIVIESPQLFREFLTRLSAGIEDGDEEIQLSEDGRSLKPSDTLELVQQFVPFSLNGKTLLAALAKRMERLALSPEWMERTQIVLGESVRFLREVSLDFSHEIEIGGLTVGTLVKAAGLRFMEDEVSLADLLLAYMRLVRELVGERVFVLVGVRNYLSSGELDGLFAICLAEKIRVFLLDGHAGEMLANEDRLLIDMDLCELTQADDFLV